MPIITRNMQSSRPELQEEQKPPKVHPMANRRWLTVAVICLISSFWSYVLSMADLGDRINKDIDSKFTRELMMGAATTQIKKEKEERQLTTALIKEKQEKHELEMRQRREKEKKALERKRQTQSESKKPKKESKDDKRNQQLTVLVSSFKQHYCLKVILNKLQKCAAHYQTADGTKPFIAGIHVNWFESDDPRIKLNKTLHNPDWIVPVVLDWLPDRISHRFYPRQFTSNPVFSMDVDMIYSCRVMQLALETWRNQTDLKHSSVGFYPRYLPKNDFYHPKNSTKKPYRFNTLFITKGGIVHQDMFRHYFPDSSHELYNENDKRQRDLILLRQKVDQAITAEDILLSYTLAHQKVKMIPIMTNPFENCHRQCHEYGVGSLDDRTSHQRRALLEEFQKAFGGNKDFTKHLGRHHIVYAKPIDHLKRNQIIPGQSAFPDQNCPRRWDKRHNKLLWKQRKKLAGIGKNVTEQDQPEPWLTLVQDGLNIGEGQEGKR